MSAESASESPIRASAGLGPWWRLGLAGNPFSNDPVRSPPVPALEEEVLEALLSPAPLVEVRGGRGAGKTTHLEAARVRLEAQGAAVHSERVDEQGPGGVLAPPDARVWLLDEAQNLRRGGRRQLRGALRRGVRVRLATHESLEREARRAGFALLSYELAPLDRARALAVVAEAFRAATRPGTSPGIAFTPADVEALLDRSGGRPLAFREAAYELAAARAWEARPPE